jgi:SAM-dependent methyltransferase
MDEAVTRRTYERDLAYIHHVGFGDFSRNAAPGLLMWLRRAGIHAGTVVDLACGSGMWVRELQRAGYDAVGVDRSPAMLALARTIAPGARFACASLHGWDVPRCDAVTCLGEGLNYLPEGASVVPEGHGGRPSLEPLFRRIAEALRPGGLWMFDVVLGGRGSLTSRTWRTGDDWAVLVEVVESAGTGLLTRDITTFRKVGATYRRGFERHAIQLFDRAAVESLLRETGFAIRTSRRYGATRLAPRRLAFCARREPRGRTPVSR